MSIGAIIAIAIAIIIIAAAGALATFEMRSRALRQRFGPEYERLAKEKGARQAEAELTARQRRIAKLDIHPLTFEQRANYQRQWNAAQIQFVDDPADAVHQAENLVSAVQRDRGYPVDDRELAMEALTVHHARAFDRYREARGITSNPSGASTDELRQALISYRTLFRELLGSAGGSRADRSPVSVSADGNRPALPGTTSTQATAEE
jgi:hypothetical protein